MLTPSPSPPSGATVRAPSTAAAVTDGGSLHLFGAQVQLAHISLAIAFLSLTVAGYALYRAIRRERSARIVVDAVEGAARPASTTIRIQNLGDANATDVRVSLRRREKELWPFVVSTPPFPVAHGVAPGVPFLYTIDLSREELLNVVAEIRWSDRWRRDRATTIDLSPYSTT